MGDFQKAAAPEREEERLYRTFRETKQEPLRLEAALRGFFLEGVEPAQREDYGGYLRRRVRPAVEKLIEEDRADRLEQLEKLGWFDARQVDEYIRMAREREKVSALVWLLELKREKYGYHDKDFSL